MNGLMNKCLLCKLRLRSLEQTPTHSRQRTNEWNEGFLPCLYCLSFIMEIGGLRLRVICRSMDTSMWLQHWRKSLSLLTIIGCLSTPRTRDGTPGNRKLIGHILCSCQVRPEESRNKQFTLTVKTCYFKEIAKCAK